MWIKNITVVNKIFYLWRKMEESGEWSTLKKEDRKGGRNLPTLQRCLYHIKPYLSNIYISNIWANLSQYLISKCYNFAQKCFKSITKSYKTYAKYFKMFQNFLGFFQKGS
jgi:hypothetical protein